MQAVILAGGKGTHLHSLMTSVPKSMVPLFDQPVLEHQIKLLARHGIKDIIITTSPLADGIMDHFGDGSRWGVKIRYSIEHTPRGTAGALKLIQNMIKGRFIVLSGDIVTDFDLGEAEARHKANWVIASVLLGKAGDPTQYGSVNYGSDGRITKFVEKPHSSEICGHTVSTGLYIFEPELLSCIPADQEYDIARQLIPHMLNNHEPMAGLELNGYWCDVGDSIQYSNVHFDALEGRLKLEISATCIREGLWVGQRVNIHPDTMIDSPVYIGSDACIKSGVALRKRTVIGAGTIVSDHAELDRCVIGRQSFIGKNAKITNSMIGSDFHISEEETIADRVIITSSAYEYDQEATETAIAPARPVRESRRIKREISSPAL